MKNSGSDMTLIQQRLAAASEVLSMMSVFKLEVVPCVPPHYAIMDVFIDVFEEHFVPLASELCSVEKASALEPAEVLQLVRGQWGDELGADDSVTAVKLTGDTNVPAGAASFRAKVGRGARLDPHVGYPEELGVLARYKGEGRVAKPGFTEESWVEGELLVLDGQGGQLTGGAELGFVWAIPGERRFLILFTKLQLPDCD